MAVRTVPERLNGLFIVFAKRIFSVSESEALVNGLSFGNGSSRAVN
jgi:hypothetical protein